MCIATGKEAEELDQTPASAAAQPGKLGGAARAMSEERLLSALVHPKPPVQHPPNPVD
jgi:hypothetical protein